MGNDECKLLGDFFGAIIQVFLAVVCFASLLVKWQLEKPKRSSEVFLLDSSKQGFSGVCAHVTAILVSTIANSKTDPDKANECAWYFVVFMVDTTLGVFLAWSFLRLVQYVAGRYEYAVLRDTGDYGQHSAEGAHELPHAQLSPGSTTIQYRTWAIQMVAWCIITVTARITCGSIVIASRALFLHVAEQVAKPFDGQPRLMLAVVMIACPVGMNMIQLWIQDTFLKKAPEDASSVAPYDAPYSETLIDNQKRTDCEDPDDGSERGY